MRATAIPVAIILLLSATLAWELRVLSAHNRLVSHTHEVIAQTWLVNKLLVDHETGLRAYLLTHEPLFLAPYVTGRRDFPAALDELRRLVADNAAQNARVEELRLRYATWVQSAEALSTEVPPAAFRETPAALQGMRNGKVEMDAMRETIRAIHADEQGLLVERQQRAERTAGWLVAVGFSVAAILGMLAALALRHVIRSLEGDYAIAFRDQAQISRAAEQANRAKDDFLATLSHELRTPLNAILGWAHVLRGGEFDSATRNKAVETIHRNAITQSQLISDILDVSRIITGKLALNVRPTDLAEVIERSIETISPAAQARDIHVQTILDTDVVPISGDPDRLQQVVWNLLANAIKFTPKGGRVQVRLERVNSHVQIVVADNGPGIPADMLPRVFERFWQGDASASRSHGGLGLGLAIVRHLTEAHGGTVFAANREGSPGAVFTVRLPSPAAIAGAPTILQRRGASATETAWLAPPASLAGVRIVAVDDEPDARDLMRTVFARSGAEVFLAASAHEALSLLIKERPDVLVADVGMPGEDGHSLMARIRTLPADEGGNTPALALTAFARGEDRAEALRSGFDVHVPKPVEPVELIAAVRELVDRPTQPSGRRR